RLGSYPLGLLGQCALAVGPLRLKLFDLCLPLQTILPQRCRFESLFVLQAQDYLMSLVKLLCDASSVLAARLDLVVTPLTVAVNLLKLRAELRPRMTKAL